MNKEQGEGQIESRTLVKDEWREENGTVHCLSGMYCTYLRGAFIRGEVDVVLLIPPLDAKQHVPLFVQ